MMHTEDSIQVGAEEMFTKYDSYFFFWHLKTERDRMIYKGLTPLWKRKVIGARALLSQVKGAKRGARILQLQLSLWGAATLSSGLPKKDFRDSIPSLVH